ncbi:hypothetical protein GMA43_11925 [Turicibacter sanguinis]|uniref:hypothetical protein n=1 Tax=Erysipelotrichales TaxID=526525 RepID=UPI0012B91626|nr:MULTISPECIES: hypothetical protein [unclassified Turicibacter]MTH08319.1 hypothetical protein [Turicibacter sanguinis]MCU7194960.1 hypothetical protein [Turicibacter sp. T129]MCU7206343.1 hypothetical protein [Turicibacter sp. GALT-G1]MTH11131.1 hypothetical protein [Turicibacter sanguinis]MTH13905.1 hypothetical protein [Turicibacter sanguinis]
MDFFERVEKERKNIEREKNKKMKEFVIKKMNFIMNMKYILEESYGKKVNRIFNENNGYKIELDKLIDYTDEVIEIKSNVTTSNEASESQRKFSNNSYEFKLILTVDEKKDFILWFREFAHIFNELQEIERKLIYYSLVEKENNTWLALHTNYSERTIATLKVKAINEFYRKLKLGKLTYRDYFKFSHIQF